VDDGTSNFDGYVPERAPRTVWPLECRSGRRRPRLAPAAQVTGMTFSQHPPAITPTEGAIVGDATGCGLALVRRNPPGFRQPVPNLADV